MSDKKTPPTEAMFSAIAEGYDRCNHGFSLWLDHLWRRRLAKAMRLSADDTALDICCGTGDVAFALLKHTPVRQVIGSDCSEQMIQLAQEKRMLLSGRRWMADKAIDLRVEDAAALSCVDASLGGVTCAFGLRNIPERAAVLEGVFRALKPGGRFGVCEFSLPASPMVRGAYDLYLSRVMPLLGRLVLGQVEPLRYLARSIHHWHETVDLCGELTQAGFADVQATPLSGGIVTLTVARKASR